MLISEPQPVCSIVHPFTDWMNDAATCHILSSWYHGGTHDELLQYSLTQIDLMFGIFKANKMDYMQSKFKILLKISSSAGASAANAEHSLAAALFVTVCVRFAESKRINWRYPTSNPGLIRATRSP